MEFTNVFTMLVDAASRTPRYVSSCGGTRSGKTYSALQFFFLLVASDTKPTINSVVSETFPHLKRGAIRDFKQLLGEDFREDWWSRSDNAYTFPSGATIEFFSADSPAKVHGPARDRLFINEAQNIPYEIARQLFVRTKELILIDYNPTRSFWVNELIEPSPECITIHSTYLDNCNRRTGRSMLTEAQVREIESNRRDANWWRVYGEGLVGQKMGLIYPDFEQVDELPLGEGLVECYGLDFGYTNDPTALVRVLADTRRRVLWVDEMLYRTHMLNRDIVAFLRSVGVRQGVEIFADCAEPKSIDEIHFAGYNCKPCYKGRALVEQLQFLQGWELKVTKRSVNLIKELRNYTWAEDKDGRVLNVPIDLWNHALDALRYAVFTKHGTFKRPLTGGKPRTANAW